MTKEQVRYALTKEGCDPSSLDSIKSKLAVVWCDNNSHFYNFNKQAGDKEDPMHKMVDFDFTNELIIVEEFNVRAIIRSYIPFETIQRLGFYSNRILDRATNTIKEI